MGGRRLAKHDSRLRPRSRKEATHDESLVQEGTDQLPAWQLGRLHLDGDWGWSNATKDQFETLLSRLKSLEQLTWGEIERRRHCHFYESLDGLCPEFQALLEQMDPDETSHLYSLRVGEAERVWGLRYGHVLKVLWWDPQHSICTNAG